MAIQKTKELLERQNEEESGESEEEVEAEPEEKWDVESYVSTLTNTDNHPKMVQVIRPRKFKVELPKSEKPKEAQ